MKISNHVVVESMRKLFKILHSQKEEKGQYLCDLIAAKGENLSETDNRRDFTYRRVLFVKGKPKVTVVMTMLVEFEVSEEQEKSRIIKPFGVN